MELLYVVLFVFDGFVIGLPSDGSGFESWFLIEKKKKKVYFSFVCIPELIEDDFSFLTLLSFGLMDLLTYMPVQLVAVLIPIVGVAAFIWWAGRDIVQGTVRLYIFSLFNLES